MPSISEIKLIAVLLVVAAAAFLSWHIRGEIADGDLAKQKAAYAMAEAAAVEAALADVRAQNEERIRAAERQAATQAAITADTRRQLSEVQRHAKGLGKCLPIGVVRVLLAGAKGGSADGLSPASGQPDDACAPPGWIELIRGVVQDYGAARANAAQLTELQQEVRSFDKKAPVNKK